jgi:hypothetical protein
LNINNVRMGVYEKKHYLECPTADPTFQWLIQQFDGHMIVLSDTAFHTVEGDPANCKRCQRGEW